MSRKQSPATQLRTMRYQLRAEIRRGNEWEQQARSFKTRAIAAEHDLVIANKRIDALLKLETA